MPSIDTSTSLNPTNPCSHSLVSSIVRLLSQVEESFRTNKFNIKAWRQHELTPDNADSHAVDWIFAINAINFSFWSDSNPCNVKWDGKTYHGFYSLCAAFKRAESVTFTCLNFQVRTSVAHVHQEAGYSILLSLAHVVQAMIIMEGAPICDPQFYTSVSLEELQHLLRPTYGGPMPLLPLRHQLLKESGSILIQKYGGSFINCIKECDHSAEKLVKLLVDNFPSYRDEAVYEGQKVSLYKRAQIVAADLWACFEGQGLGRFDDIDTLTMFADYRVPQVLNYYGVLEYSPELRKMIQERSWAHLSSYVLKRVSSQKKLYLLVCSSREGRGQSLKVHGLDCWGDAPTILVQYVQNNHPNLRTLSIVSDIPMENGSPMEVEIRGNTIWAVELICQELKSRLSSSTDIVINPSIVDYYLWEHRIAKAKEMASVGFHKTRCIYY
ncbi:C9orf64 [Cordylochernes scorpioides]|uniref:Queuosine 5'-phosphate N-glycosylase/hydrolase n=1 Tax=Cordylochernes scorpioides TaxID=51811 RepID=A0ABY6KVU6_9ARAC|nr:C9orf64 [Cordylochernes scorpioides]